MPAQCSAGSNRPKPEGAENCGTEPIFAPQVCGQEQCTPDRIGTRVDDRHSPLIGVEAGKIGDAGDNAGRGGREADENELLRSLVSTDRTQHRRTRPCAERQGNQQWVHRVPQPRPSQPCSGAAVSQHSVDRSGKLHRNTVDATDSFGRVQKSMQVHIAAVPARRTTNPAPTEEWLYRLTRGYWAMACGTDRTGRTETDALLIGSPGCR